MIVIEVTGRNTGNAINSVIVYVPTKLIRCTVWCNWFPANQWTNNWSHQKQSIRLCAFLSVQTGKNPLKWPFPALKTHTTIHRINTVVSKVTKFSLINIVADLIWQETQKLFYAENGTINTAIYGWLLYILLHPWEYLGIYFTGKSANQIPVSYIFCSVKWNKVPLSD